MAVNIRKFVLQAHSLDELVALGTITTQAARFLQAAGIVNVTHFCAVEALATG